MSNTILDSFLHKEVYIIGPDEDFIGKDSIFITDQWDYLLERMKILSPATDGEAILLHGFLATANIVPPNLYGKTPFLVIYDKSTRDDLIEGIIIPLEEVTNTKELAKQVEEVLHGRTGNRNINAIEPEIDDIYILYGYRLELCLAPNEDDEDEEAILKCQEIISEIDGIITRNKGIIERSNREEWEEWDDHK
jgi:hypothetical protein